MDFEVNLYNSQSVTHFGCHNWEALCKMYGFYEGMIVTMDLGDPDIKQHNMDIWVLVDTLPILPQCEFLCLKIFMVFKTHPLQDIASCMAWDKLVEL